MKKTILVVLAALVMATGVLALGAQTHALECSVLPSSVCDKADAGDTSDVSQTGVWALLLFAVQVMTAGVFLLAIAGVVYGAVLFTTAAGNAEQVKKGRMIITNTVIGMLAFALMYALLQWLIPGGVFNGTGGTVSV
jgi:predicted secreted protein